jgi:hypothetical protein
MTEDSTPFSRFISSSDTITRNSQTFLKYFWFIKQKEKQMGWTWQHACGDEKIIQRFGWKTLWEERN